MLRAFYYGYLFFSSRLFRIYAPPSKPTGIPISGVTMLLKINMITVKLSTLNQLIVKFLNPHMIV